MNEENPLDEIENEPTDSLINEEVEEKTESTEVEGKAEEKTEKKKQSRSAYRIEQLNTQLREQEREADKKLAEQAEELKILREQSRIKSEPDPDNYADHDQYRDDSTKWKKQEDAKTRQEIRNEILEENRKAKHKEEADKMAENYAEKKREANGVYDNYQASEDKVIEVLRSHGDFAAQIQRSILRAKHSTAIVNYFGENLDKLQELAFKSPEDQAETVWDLNKQLSAKTLKTKSTAPNPTRSEKGGAPRAKASTGGSKHTYIKGETHMERAKRLNGR